MKQPSSIGPGAVTYAEQKALTAKLLGPECIPCALKQTAAAMGVVGDLPRDRRMALMQRAVEQIAERGVDRNNCEILDEAYRLVTAELGDEDPYREMKRTFNAAMMKVCPGVQAHIRESADPLAAAVRASIAGNLIDFVALGLEVDMNDVMAQLRAVDDTGLYIDHIPALRQALEKAHTLLVLGDNCGEIVMDRLLIETIRALYPHLTVQYSVRGAPAVNDVTRDDAEQVGMDQAAEVIDNGDRLLTTLLYRTSEAFNAAFDAADVVIAKGMGNYEGLYQCGRGNIFFLMIAKCDVIARMVGVPKGSVMCMMKES